MANRKSLSNVLQMDLDRHTARAVIKEALDNSSRVFFSPHAKERMNERKVTDTQVHKVLKHGRITEGPARSSNGNWTMTVEGMSAGDAISVPIAIDFDEKSGNYIIIITVIRSR